MKKLLISLMTLVLMGCNSQPIKVKTWVAPSLYDEVVFSCVSEEGGNVSVFVNKSAYVWTIIGEPLTTNGKPGMAYSSFSSEMETGYYEDGGNSIREVKMTYPPYELTLMQSRVSTAVDAQLYIKDTNSNITTEHHCVRETIESELHDESLFEAMPVDLMDLNFN